MAAAEMLSMRAAGILCVALAAGCAPVQMAPPTAIAQPEPPAAVPPPMAVAPEAVIAVEPVAAATVAVPAPSTPAASTDTPITNTPSPEKPAKAAPPPAKAPAKIAAIPLPAPPPVAVAKPPEPKAPEPSLDLAGLTARLRESKAVGVMTKLALKNQVDDLLKQFRVYYQGGQKNSIASLRPSYDMLVLKVLAVVQDGDPALARSVAGSREAIWAILSDREKFKLIA